MRIRWTPAAASDLAGISDFLSRRHSSYRQPTMNKLYDAIRSLKNWPTEAGRERRKARRSYYFRRSPALPWTASVGRQLKSYAFITPRGIWKTSFLAIQIVRTRMQPGSQSRSAHLPFQLVLSPNSCSRSNDLNQSKRFWLSSR